MRQLRVISKESERGNGGGGKEARGLLTSLVIKFMYALALNKSVVYSYDGRALSR